MIMAPSRNTRGFFKNHIIISICLHVLTTGVKATGFITAKSCGKELKLESMAFPPGSVWMKIVSASYLFVGHGVFSSTSGPILVSGDTPGRLCNLTPFKTMQVITSPDNEVHLKDPASRQISCKVKNVALSLREATGYISCEREMNNAEIEIDQLIQKTDATASVLLNEEPKPATTRSPRIERTSPASTLAFPVREKRKLHQISTPENLLYSKGFVEREYTVSNTPVLGLSSELLHTTKSNDSSLLRGVETSLSTMTMQESSQDLLSPTVLPYDSKEPEGRPTPKPSLYNWHFLESSTTVTNSITVPLGINLQPTSTFSKNVSLIDFSFSEDDLASTSEMPSETTMIFGALQDSFGKIGEEPAATVESLIGILDSSSFVPQSIILEYVVESATVEDEYDYDLPEYDETVEDTVYLNANNSSDYPQHSDHQSTEIIPTSVLEPSNIFVTVPNGNSSPPKNASFSKSYQTSVKMVSTNEEIQNKIVNLFSPITNLFSYFKASTSQEHDSHELPEATSKPSGNLSFKAKNNNDKNASVSLDFSSSTYRVPELVTSRFFLTALKNDTYPELHQIDSSEASNQNGNELSNVISNYVSGKLNVSLSASKEISVSSSISPASQRNHSTSNISPLNSPVNLSHVRRLSEKQGDTTDEANFALPVTTGKSLHSDVNMVSVSEDIRSQEVAKSQRSNWILLIGGGIVLQVQLIIGLIIIWCCLRRKFKRYGDTEAPANIYDGFSKVVNFRNSEKLSDDPEKCSALGDENESGSTAEANAKLPKCLTTSL